MRCSFGEHSINYNFHEIKYSSQVLQEAKSIYGRLVKISNLKTIEIKKLDDFYESLQKIIPFMEKTHEDTFTTMFAGRKKRNKLLSNKRIILVSPEENYTYPAFNDCCIT